MSRHRFQGVVAAVPNQPNLDGVLYTAGAVERVAFLLAEKEVPVALRRLPGSVPGGIAGVTDPATAKSLPGGVLVDVVVDTAHPGGAAFVEGMGGRQAVSMGYVASPDLPPLPPAADDPPGTVLVVDGVARLLFVHLLDG